MPISYAGEPAGLSLQDELSSLRTVWGAVEMLWLLQNKRKRKGLYLSASQLMCPASVPIEQT